MKIKAIIFDMDGVLIEAREWHYESLNAALSLFGAQISRYDHLVTFDGLPTRKKLELLSIEGGFPYKLHDFVHDLKQQYTMEKAYAKCKPVFQHQFALSKLKAEGYKLAVGSNSVRKTVEIMMEKSGLMQYQDVEKSKPHPEMYSTAIKRLGIKPNECLIVEDNVNGVKAALAAGAYLLKVENPDHVHYFNIKKRIEELENA
jgi:beta-phosphoglucomutase